MTIVEFIEQRLTEDEQAAREAMDDGHNWLVEEETIDLYPDDREPYDGFMSFPRKAHAHHAALHDPARVLRQCAATRTLLEFWSKAYQNPQDAHLFAGPDWDLVRGNARWTLRKLAAPYADHPDYREEWSA